MTMEAKQQWLQWLPTMLTMIAIITMVATIAAYLALPYSVFGLTLHRKLQLIGLTLLRIWPYPTP